MSEMAEAVQVDSRSVACDGGSIQLGHPKVYIAIGKTNEAMCPYCGKRFVYDPAKGSDEQH